MTTEPPRHFQIRAGWLFPVDQTPIRGGTITVRDGHIESIGKCTSGVPTHEFAHAAVLPGLVNPHVHLEFSRLASPFGAPGIPLPQWIDALVSWRRQRIAEAAADPSDDPSAAAIEHGLLESARAGVTTVGEISTHDVDSSKYAALGLAGVVFRELLGFRAARLPEQQRIARRYEPAPEGSASHIRWGLSPHAPYTVRWELLQWIVQRACERDLPLAMHVAESREELELLAAGTGPLRGTLQRLEAWDDHASARRSRPLDYLRLLSRARRSLVIHGNYLGPDDWDHLARHADRMTVVYCPRTHAYFQHEPYPLARMLERGVRVAIGTDSRASNPDLSLLSELRCAARRHPAVDPAKILHAGTLGAAAALGCASSVGSLTVGKRADLVVVPIDENSTGDPWTALLATDHPAQLTLRGGMW